MKRVLHIPDWPVKEPFRYFLQHEESIQKRRTVLHFYSIAFSPVKPRGILFTIFLRIRRMRCLQFEEHFSYLQSSWVFLCFMKGVEEGKGGNKEESSTIDSFLDRKREGEREKCVYVFSVYYFVMIPILPTKVFSNNLS